MGKYFVLIMNLVYMVIVSVILGCAALLFYPTFKMFMCVFLSTFAIQLIVGKMWSDHVELKMDTIINNENYIDSIKHVELDCSYCNQKNKVELLLNNKNEFTCIHCNSVNGININISTVRTTSEVRSIDVMRDIFKKLDEKKG